MSEQPDEQIVEVRIPADVVFVATLRLTAASLAARCNLTVDDIEDLRLAVDEACALLLPHVADGTQLDARFVLGDGRLSVSVSAVPTGSVATGSVSTAAPATPDRDGIAWMVLEALASSVDVHQNAGTLRITLTKARQAAPA